MFEPVPVRLRPLAVAIFLTAVAVLATPAVVSAATISGTAYKDLNRNALRDFGEPPMSDQQIYLFDASGKNTAVAQTDASGAYAFGDLPDGSYRVAYASPSWWAIRDNWVPTTTGSLRPSLDVSLNGSAVADFGWREIARSTDASAPKSTYTGATGLRVSSYDDVVPAREIYDALATARIGAEAPYTEVRFDFYPGSQTVSSARSDGAGYVDYSAISYVSYLSWLDAGDRTLVHEYGHAWSLYHAYIVQQDPTLAVYLKARGLADDSRVGSSYAWQAREMIAEDYRQLFGSANARSGGQINTEIPPATEVPGLKEFLSDSFTTAPAPAGPTPAPTPTPTTTPSPTPEPTATPAPAPLQVATLAMNPSAVKTTGTVTFSLSAPARVTLRILNSKGSLVRTLLSSQDTPAGSTAVGWDRKDNTGRRVGKGTYRLQADALDTDNGSATATASFTVTG